MTSDISLPARPHAPCPVGVFDSGVGGLSIVREILHQSPDQPIIYLADQAHTPYGQRSLEEIRRLAHGITRFLLDEGACVIVIACNTASAAALRWLRREMPGIPFVGMEPAVKPAAERTRSRHVGVIATSATFQGELFASLVDRFATNATIHTQVCPELVPLVEAGELDTERAARAVAGCLAPLLDAGIDELVLGCTHYPFLLPLIERAAGPNVEIIDPAPAVARQTGRVVADYDKLDRIADLHHPIFYTTGDPRRFREALVGLLGLCADVRGAQWSETGALEPIAVSQENPKDIPTPFGI